MSDLKTTFKAKFPDIVFDEPLARYCTFRIGGPADYFYRLKDSALLPDLISFAKENSLPYFIFGGGSNILFHDDGFRGLVIHLESSKIEIKDTQIIADAGVSIPQLIKAAIESHLFGLEKWGGLPGTVGGAVRGNAGCNGLETKDILIEATLLSPETGKIHVEPAAFFNYSYRNSSLKYSHEIVLNATFQLKKSEISKEEQQKLYAETIKERASKQPPGSSCGSFFKNPSPENPAGKLIDLSGLKGTKIGGAQISEKHGNFFMNTGSATFADMLALSELAKKEVKSKFGIDLEEEIQIVQP